MEKTDIDKLPTIGESYILKYFEQKEKLEKLEKILSEHMTDKELKKCLHMKDIEEKNRKLKHEVRVMQQKAEEFNNLLYATGLIVNCTGCIAGKPFDGENLTEEKVKAVEMIARRLRDWWGNYNYRKSYQK